MLYPELFKQLEAVRWSRISIIFQGAMNALTPA